MVMNPIFNPHNPILNPHDNLIDLAFDSPNLQLVNIISGGANREIEMFNVQSTNYVSLKDLMPAASARPTLLPESYSWKEIPIKDPLLQHAAWAYLKPVARSEETRWWKKLKENCCRLFGCLDDVVSSVVLEGWFAEEENGDGR
ncbi:hypothetical protein ABFS82_02G005600 [Erythranthe guttata]